MSNVTIGNLKTPKKMPESQVQRIKNLTCPPPIMPSKTSKRIQDLLNQIQNQKQEIISIQTPPDTYKPDKIGQDITVNTLEQKRMDEIETKNYAI